MGKKRIQDMGAETPEKKEKQKVHIPGLKGGQRVVAIASDLPVEPTTEVQETPEASKSTKTRAPKKRGKKYLTAKAKIEPGKKYSPQEAVELAKQTSTSHFDGQVELHATLTQKEPFSKQVELPFTTGNKKKIEFATDETIEKIKTGKIDFDILAATAEMMPRLVPFAKVLGPKGLMPNPKHGTLVKNEEEAKSKFSGNTLRLKSEPKAPLIHTTFGKVSQSQEELKENLQTIVAAIGKANIKKATISATMGPSIPLAI